VTPPSALPHFPEIADRLRSKRLLLGLDFDGVLAPIVRVIPNAEAGAPMRALLRRLARLSRVRPAIVTGRRLFEIKAKLPISGLAYSGNHGLEIEDGRFRYLHPDAKRLQPYLPRLQRDIEKAIAPFPGAEIEFKDISLSVHFRKCAPRAARAGLRAALRTVRASRSPVRWHTGKRVVEVQPTETWNKGDAFGLLHDRIGGIPVFLGDDAGDEHAFKVADDRGGFGIRVSPRGKTAARYSIPSQRGVARFLERIAENFRK
jgi:trehalose-phosphatase